METSLSSLRQILSRPASDALWTQLVHSVAGLPFEHRPDWLPSWLKQHLAPWPDRLKALTTALVSAVSTEHRAPSSALLPLLPSVTVLSLLASEETRPLLSLSCWESLRSLEWSEDTTPSLAMDMLASAPWASRLRQLRWANNHTTVETLPRLLPALKRMSSLRTLDLRDNELEDVGVERLVGEFTLPALRLLNLTHNELTNDFTDYTVEPLFSAGPWAHVRVVLEEVMYAGMGRSGPLRKELNTHISTTTTTLPPDSCD